MQTTRYYCYILIKLELLWQILEKSQISNLMKLHSVGAKFFYNDRQTWQNNVAFCNFENMPKNT